MRRFGLLVLAGGLLASMATPASAFLLFLLGSEQGAKPQPPPTSQELAPLNAETPIRPGALPAPLLVAPGTRAMPGLDGAAPPHASLSLPAPPMQLAQVTNEELLRRLERLEQENRQLRSQGAGQTPAPRSGLESAPLPAQVTTGWWVHLHSWNAEGNLGAGPLRTFRYDPQRFNFAIGHRPELTHNLRSEIYLYRYEAWLRVTQAGTYQVGANLNCAWNHWCSVAISLGGVRLAQFEGNNSGVVNHIVFAARTLEPGDYRMEMTFNLTRSQFINYRPTEVTIEPVIRTPTDMNFRPFGPNELLIPDRRDVPLGPTIPWDR